MSSETTVTPAGRTLFNYIGASLSSSDRKKFAVVAMSEGRTPDEIIISAILEYVNKPIKKAGYTSEFEAAWEKRPKRANSEDKKKAFQKWNARMKEGHTAGKMTEGLERYKAYCDATGKTGTEYVMHVATFFGPADPPWFISKWSVFTIPQENKAPRSQEDWLNWGKAKGIGAVRGETWPDYIKRLQIAWRDRL